MSAHGGDRGGQARGTSRKVLLVIVFLVAFAVFFALDGPRHLDLATVREQRETLRAFTASHFAVALLLAFAIYVAVVALSVPGATVLSLAAGFVFGRWLGTLLVLAAATLGAILVFLAARYLFGAWAQQRIGTAGARIRDGFTADAFNYLLFLRLVPLFPFFLVNLAAALMPIPLRTYAASTFIGIAPGAFAYANLGEALGQVDSTSGLLEPTVLFALGLLAILSLVPVWVRRRRSRG